MKNRFIVKNVVSDYGVFDTQYRDGEHLDCICSARANADLIADILNTDYSKPNECTYYENKLQQENQQLKEQLAEQIDYKDEYYHYWQETKKENELLKKALELALTNLYYADKEYYIGASPSQEEYVKLQTKFWLEQAKESMK